MRCFIAWSDIQSCSVFIPDVCPSSHPFSSFGHERREAILDPVAASSYEQATDAGVGNGAGSVCCESGKVRMPGSEKGEQGNREKNNGRVGAKI